MQLLFGNADIYNWSFKCRSSLRTENDKVIQEPIYHSHGSCNEKARAKVLQEQMKDKMTALSATNRNVIGETLTDVSSDVLTYLPKKTSLQRSLRMYKNADHLPVPTLTISLWNTYAQ